jgi:acyl-CoA synthetase (AMP-forming)/AMP-acid ligase II
MTPPDFVSHLRASLSRTGSARGFTFIRGGHGPDLKERLSFREIDAAARRVAAGLIVAGHRGRPVLLLYPEGLEFLTVFLGCLYAGTIAVPAPLPAADPGAQERTRMIVADADIGLVLTVESELPAIHDWIRDEGIGTRLHAGTAAQLPTGTDAAEWAPEPADARDTAFLQYTSGSTRRPAGVVVTHGNLAANSSAIKNLIDERTPDGAADGAGVAVGWIPHFHDMGLVGLLLQPLYRGDDCVFTPASAFVRRPRLWLELITRYRGTFTVAPDFGYELLLGRLKEEDLAGLDLSSLRIAMNGAEPVRAATLERVAERFEAVGFRCSAWMPCYGMAESTLLVTASSGAPVLRAYDEEALALGEARRVESGERESPGRVLVGSGTPRECDLAIVDPGTREPLAGSAIGEIWLRGPSVARGYWPYDGEGVFDAYDARGGGPWLRTGDLGFLDDGQLFVTGRAKDVLIVNGRNVDAHDVEATARSSHPALRLGAASHLDVGREQPVLVQEIVTSRLDGLSLPDLSARLAERLAERHALGHAALVLVPRGTVSRTTSGKTRRAHTRDRWLAGQLRVLYENAGARRTREEHLAAGGRQCAETHPTADEHRTPEYAAAPARRD